MGNSTGLAVLLVGGLAVLLLFSGTIVAWVQGVPGFIEDFIARIKGSLPGVGGNVSGYCWIGYTVAFTDGSVEDVRMSRPAFSIAPLSITFSGKEMSSLTVNIRAQMDQGTVDQWTSESSLRVELYKKPEQVPKTSSTGSYPMSGGSWGTSTIKTLGSFTVNAVTLENDVIKQYGDGNYLLQSRATVNITVTSAGSTFSMATDTLAGGVDITYTGGTPSGFSVTGGTFSLIG